DRGHGLGIAPMIMAGSTAPVTMAGAMVLVVAEVLASNFMVMALTGEPSNYFGHGSHSNDPRTMLCSFGAPNQALLAIASAQMGRFYGIDAGSNSALSDALMPDFQCGFEKAFSALYGALAGTVSIGCQGITGADQGFSFEQLVIDDEWLDACNYVAGGIEVNEETIAEELIHEVGIGGNFLGEEHTAKHLRRNFWPSRLFDRYDFDRWKQLGATELLDRASALVDRLTDGYRDAAPVLDPAKCGALDRIARAGYRKILGADSPYVAR
ncbi:MAG: hypothetical protein GX558_02120, partial [Clostridiales bacterium]|nr:hypothetical protein [Clostridiales bacterium]